MASNADLYQAVVDGRDVAVANYANPLAVADGAITELRAIIIGNGLGKFGGTPFCSTWFSKAALPSVKVREESKPGDGAGKRQRLDPDDLETKKGQGMLCYDAQVGGTPRLPNLAVYAKKKGARGPERICMKFSCRGHVCTAQNCP